MHMTLVYISIPIKKSTAIISKKNNSIGIIGTIILFTLNLWLSDCFLMFYLQNSI